MMARRTRCLVLPMEAEREVLAGAVCLEGKWIARRKAQAASRWEADEE